MSNDIVPIDNGPDEPHQHARHSDDRAGDNTQARGRRQRRPRKSKIYSPEDCVRILSQLPGLIMAKMCTASEANAILRTLVTILAESRTSQSASPSQRLGDNVISILRGNPELLAIFEPLLTDEQIESLVKDVTDDNQPEI